MKKSIRRILVSTSLSILMFTQVNTTLTFAYDGPEIPIIRQAIIKKVKKNGWIITDYGYKLIDYALAKSPTLRDTAKCYRITAYVELGCDPILETVGDYSIQDVDEIVETTPKPSPKTQPIITKPAITTPQVSKPIATKIAPISSTTTMNPKTVPETNSIKDTKLATISDSANQTKTKIESSINKTNNSSITRNETNTKTLSTFENNIQVVMSTDGKIVRKVESSIENESKEQQDVAPSSRRNLVYIGIGILSLLGVGATTLYIKKFNRL